MAAPVKMLLSIVADVVVYVRLIMLELLEGSVDISDITLLHALVSIKLFFALPSTRVVSCIILLF